MQENTNTTNTIKLTRKPTLANIKSIIQEALQTPSGDNAQPWRFRWDGEKLQVLYARKSGEHVLNHQERISVLTLGTVIEAIRLSASRFGLSTKATLILNQENDLSVWAEVYFSSTAKSPEPLAQMISRRTTDRRPFRGGDIDAEILKQIRSIESDFPGLKIHLQENPSKKFMNYYLQSERLFWTNKNIIRDLSKWLRLTEKEVSEVKTGMSWKNIGLNSVEALLFRVIRIFPVLPKLLWHFGFGLKLRSQMKTGVESSAALLCFTAPDASYESLYKVGQMAYRAWLLLNSKEFGVQPLSYCSFSVADFKAGALDHKNESQERDFFKKGSEVLQETFQLTEQETPIWMFRTGLSSELPENQRAAKYNVEDVLV